jgi:nucleoside-diphosphate-sugar epimerase
MKIFLTGGTGYIGQRLVHALLDQEHEVHGLARNAANRRLEEHPRLHWFAGDIMDRSSIDRAMQGCEAAFHAAAFARVWSRDKNMYYRQNVEATEQILESALAHKVRKLVFTSSAGVFGPSNGKPITENHERIIPFNNEYEETKHQAEEKVRAYAKKGLETVIVNPARVYGPGKMDRSNPVTRYINILRKSRFGVIPGSGKQIGSYCFVDDIVKGHILALEKGVSGERYILGGENITYRDIVGIVEDEIEAKRYKIYMPLSIMKGLSAIELLRAKVSSHEPWIIPKWISKYLYDCVLDSSKACNELGYTITPFRKGTARTIEWLNEQD